MHLMNSNRQKLERQLSPAKTVDYAKIDSSQPDSSEIASMAVNRRVGDSSAALDILTMRGRTVLTTGCGPQSLVAGCEWL